ncbi:MAG: DEAD/DEAH box helicase [Spirochaetales bacterium]|nr:DEAD/DEAH box helicase [Spirochaetales bacterium]
MKHEFAKEISDELLEWLSRRGEIAWVDRITPREAQYEPLPSDLDPWLVNALTASGIRQLYKHQRRAYELARGKRDCIVVTPTASGKTLCYNLPVMQTLLEQPNARALYLFPTKALSQDQQSALNEIILEGGSNFPIMTYDGDTPASIRSKARTEGRIIISNPDMLHTGILPNHTKWIKFFSNLKFVVIDELHAYRGVFGSHVACVIRRLLRIARFYGSEPVFLFASATLANPAELASMIAGRQVELVDESGASSGEKLLICYNPPVVDAVQGIRRSSALESEAIMLWLLEHGIKTILFSRSRMQVELLASYISSKLRNPYNENHGITVKPYRSGLLPSERRMIEKGLREGSIHGVVSTNALELGIDIGGLDAAVIAGYPGSIASFWQQAGRAGRRSSLSLGVLVASSSPLDQYLAAHPEYLLANSVERAHLDPYNPYIFVDHLKCAAFELPFSEHDAFSATPKDQKALQATAEGLEFLEAEGIVRHTAGRYFWSAEGYPGEKISLRSATTENIVIVDMTNGGHKVIGEMDRPSAKELLFDQAVYLHLGTQYMVKKLDLARRVCEVERSDADYWTDAIVKYDIEVLAVDERHKSALHERLTGDVLVRSQVEKYKKLKFNTHENIGFGEIYQPPEEMQTRALILVLDPVGPAYATLRSLPPDEADAALDGFCRLVRLMAPAYILCDAKDIGKAHRLVDPYFGSSSLYFYDRYPGGTGLAEALGTTMQEVLQAALERVTVCACSDGCPSCIGVDAGKGGKKVVQSLLTLLLQEAPEGHSPASEA